jgi:ADP-heptose:LPS heptosyltransferase
MKLSKKTKAFLLRKLTDKVNINFDLKQTSSVLFMRYDRIGDMLISTPVFRELKTANPYINVIVLASESNRDILKNNPYVDEIIINYKNNLLGDFFSLLKLRRLNIDVCIEFDHSVVPHAIMRLRIINPKKIISVKKDGRYGVNGDELKMYNFYTKKLTNEHSRNVWLGTLAPFGIKPKSSIYDLFISEAQEKKALDFLSKFYKVSKVGINLEGAVKGKKIKINELKKICEGIKRINIDAQIIILSSPKNYENVNNIINHLSLEYVTATYLTKKILEVAGLIKYLDLIISPDTSIVHIASALNKPIVSIHEKNMASFRLFAPTSSKSRTVFSQKEDSIEGFDVAKVIEFSNELLKEIN